jgi:hypothetical protein
MLVQKGLRVMTFCAAMLTAAQVYEDSSSPSTLPCGYRQGMQLM